MQLFLFLFSPFLLTFIFTKLFLKISRTFNVKQFIREEGPAQHIKKTGTPTMGGIVFMPVIIIFLLSFLWKDSAKISLAYMVLAFLLIGFIDDTIKILGKNNHGLNPSQKMGLQILAALLWGSYLLFKGHESFYPGWIYLPFISLLIVGMSNAANLTDGLDGLLAGCSLIGFLFFSALALKLGMPNIALTSIAATGSISAFLFFNLHPAKIFMGDCGSLGIGALLTGVAILLHREFLLLIICGVLVIETLSVIIQVAYFKMTGRRIFKMSPLHHHFELLGYTEKQIVFGFWAVSFIFGLVGFLAG